MTGLSSRAGASLRGGLVVAAVALAACVSEPRGPCRPHPPPGEVGSICGFRNPEDVLAVEEAGLLLVSQMDGGAGGSLAALPLDGAGAPRELWPGTDAAAARGRGIGDARCPGPPEPRGFAPHGIAAAPAPPPGSPGAGIAIGVVAHGAREAVELFELRGAGAAARLVWRGCAPLPPDTSANDLVLPGDGTIVATNYQPTLAGWRGALHAIRGGLGLETGDVLRFTPDSGWIPLRGSGAANPNGVLVAADGRVFFAETGSGRIAVLDRVTGERREVAIGGHPDNLSWSSRGGVLALTHSSGLGFLRCTVGGGACRAAWSLFEIDPVTLAAEELLHHDGEAVGGVASVAVSRGRFYFGAVFGDRIGVWEPPRGGATHGRRRLPVRSHQVFAALPRERAGELLRQLAERVPGAFAQALAAAAAAEKARPVYLQRQPFEKRAEAVRRTLARVTANPLAEELLAVYFLECRKELLLEWLDTLGIEHEDGALASDEPPEPEQAQLDQAVQTFRSAGDDPDRELLLRAFAAQGAIRWPAFEALLGIET